MDGVGCSYKRKAVESLPGNSFHCSDASTSMSTTVMGPVDTRQPIEVGLRDGSASYRLAQDDEGDGPIASDESSSRSVGVWSSVSGVGSAHRTHNNGYPLTRGSYSSSQSCRQGIPFRFDQPWSSNSIDGGVLGWSPPTHVMPIMHASNIDGIPMELGSQGVQGLLEANGNRSFSSSLHFPFFNKEHFNVPYPSPPLHGIRGRNGNLTLHPHAPAPFQRAPFHSVSHPGPFESTGFRIQWPHNAGIVLETTNLWQYNEPHSSASAVDEVAMIGYGEVYTVGSYDHHRDMCLYIEDMSYEELLALGELIGNVNTGLPEETITRQLKTRTWASLLSINLEELPCEDQQAAFCIICQDAYEDRDKVGSLECRHEYVDCLKKWLLVKNVRPICKSEALPANSKDL